MHKIQCQCGALSGHIQGAGTCNRIVCYCADCQAFAKFLGRAGDVLDAQGGTGIVQLAQPRVVISQGKEHLAAVRLSDQGMIRWYAACCNTPLGNTLPDPKVSFIGLIHSVLDHAKIADDFGKNIAIVNVDSATGEPKPKQKGLAGMMVRFLWILLSMRMGGKYRKSPFFTDSGEPVVSPVILRGEALKNLKNTL